MKTEEQIKKEAQRCYDVFMNPGNKKPIRDDAYLRFHALLWVLEDEEDIIKKRWDEINAGRTAKADPE